jgi:D-sedoheptulose 7-phosphate isomerase
MDYARSYAEEIKATLDRLPWEDIRKVIDILHDARLDGRQVFILGNGGSAATASHFACDLGKGTAVPGYPLFRAIALTDNMALFSAYANDYGYEQVFAKQLANLVQPRDVVIGISGSGNSANVLNAIQLARERGAATIGFVGFDGGRLEGMVDFCVHVENGCMEQVEDVHVVLSHLIATALRKILLMPQTMCPTRGVEETVDVPGSA